MSFVVIIELHFVIGLRIWHRHGLTWYEIDTNWYGIWSLQKLGLAWDVKRVRLAELERGQVAAPNGRLISPETAAEFSTAGD